MGTTWADATMAVAAVLSLFVTGGGLVAVFIQIKKLREAVWGETNGRLCDQSLELLRFLAEKPDTYEFFYRGIKAGDDHPDRVFILYASEAIANFIEHVALQKPNLTPGQWDTWQRFIRSTYDNSPAVRDFLERHPDWYSEELRSILEGRGK